VSGVERRDGAGSGDGVRPGAPKWILVVDDDSAVRELWLDALEPVGYRVLASRDGAEALDMLRSVVPDLILLDLRMPRMAGDEFLEALRHQGPFTRYVRLILVSGYLGQITRIPPDVQVMGALEKPVSRDVLLRAVATVLARSPSPPSAPAAGGAPPDRAATCAACSNGLEAAATIPGIDGRLVHLHCWARALEAETRDRAQSSSRSAVARRS
jgi:CheY-like chemotaxis protein